VHVPDSVRFSETLAGELSGHDTRFLLTVVTPDIATLVADPRHRSPAWGCLIAPWLAPEPIGVVDGRLDLFVDTPDRRAVWMDYRLDLRTPDGGRFVLLGRKELRKRWSFATFPWDSTTLRCELREGSDDGPVRATGVLREGLVGLIGQAATLRASGRWYGLAALLGFFRYYLGTVWRVYRP
jgi:hypothetical protein